MFLGDEEMAIITRTESPSPTSPVRSRHHQQRVVDPIMAAEKAGYKHFMLKGKSSSSPRLPATILGRVSQGYRQGLPLKR